jgi:hypothetical protein
MARNYNRRQALAPWYHKPKDRCVTITLAQEQCSYSASYESVDDSGRIKACKVHADMLILDGVKMRQIKPAVINIQDYVTVPGRDTRVRRAG